MKAFIKLRCAFLRRSHWGSVRMTQNKLKLDAAGRNYELDSCIPVSRLTMNCSWMSLRKSQALCIPPHKNGGTSRAFCTPRDEKRRQSQAVCTFRAPHSRKLRHVSGGLHAHDAFADSFRRLALLEHPIHENCRTSQAPCTPMMKTLRQSQALSSPVTTIAERLRLSGPT